MRDSIDFMVGAEAVYQQAVSSLFAVFEDLCEGAVAVDARARIVWISDKYRVLLGLPEDQPVIGRNVEEVIPSSLLRQVVETGRPILLDIMQFGERWFVVTRMPLKDPDDTVTGAIGFVLFDRLDYLKPIITKVTQLQNELASARRELAMQRRAKYTLSQFVGTSPAIREVKRQARRAAQLDTTVMLLGETGTGKELLAHAIHGTSARANRSLVSVNVAAIPETLLEAEFFGVVPGAYTGADRKGREGKFKLADGGTLFLDEIGEMPLHVQAKLLRALQEQEIEPLGSDRIVNVDVRVIAATSRDLQKLVHEGKFRADLYYRLNVLPIELPPLRDRLSDLEPLSEIVLEQVAARMGTHHRDLTPAALDLLGSCDWPGNVRELRNVLERACALTDAAHLDAKDFAAILPTRAMRTARATGSREARPVRPLADAVAETERAAIRAALDAAGGKKVSAAKLLGISRAKLYDKLEKLELVSEIPT